MDGNFLANILGAQPLISYAPPSGFSAAHDGISVETIGKDGEVDLDWLCSPLSVVAAQNATTNALTVESREWQGNPRDAKQ